MLVIEEKELNQLLEKKFQEGVCLGIKIMKQKMLSAYDNGSPIELNDGRAYFIKSDIDHLREVIANLKKDSD